MISLLKAELKKIFKKKSFLVVTLIFIMYAFLVVFLYSSMANEAQVDNLIEIDARNLGDINSSLDLEREEDLEKYVDNISILELEDLRNNYQENNQKYLVDNFIYEKIKKKNEVKYLKVNEKEVLRLEEEIEELKTYVDNNDWQYFVNIKIEELEALEKDTTNVIDKERINIRIKLNKYRLDNNVDFDYKNYLNRAISFIDTNLFEYMNLKNKEVKSNVENERYEYLIKEMAINEYILNNKQDINSGFNLRALVRDFAIEFGLFILIYVVLICGMIVSEEFNKGTIKSLLTKPYKRSTILLAKYLSLILLVPFIILFMFLIAFLIGGLILGFNSITIPVVLFHSVKEILVVQNVFLYSLRLIISILPMYLVLGTFAFFVSTVFCSTSAAVTLTFALYLVGNVLNQFYLNYDLKFLRYFVSLHWDFSYLVDLSENIYNMKPLASLGLIGIYISVILCITFGYFKKKDVKNI